MIERSKILVRAAKVAAEAIENKKRALEAMTAEDEERIRKGYEQQAEIIAKQMLADIENQIMARATQGERSFTVMKLSSFYHERSEIWPVPDRVFDKFNRAHNMAFGLVLDECKALGLSPQLVYHDTVPTEEDIMCIQITW